MAVKKNVVTVDNSFVIDLNKILYIKVTKLSPKAKMVEENGNGLDLFVLDDAEVQPNILTVVKTGFKVEVPYGYLGIVVLDDEIAKNGVNMTNSPFLIVGEKEIELFVTTIDWFIFRQGRKIGRIFFIKLELFNYSYV